MKTSANTFFSGIDYSKAAALLAAVVLLLAQGSCMRSSRAGEDKGHAVVSWYGPGFHGKLTASGETYNMNAMTCAHKRYPFGTILKLINIETDQSATVTVNDRGPFVAGRDIDLSKAAAERVGIIGPGTGRVRVIYMGRDMRYNNYIKGGSIAKSVEYGQGPFTIQIAAFMEKSNADYMKSGLDLNHKNVYMMEKWIDGTRFYRVRLGVFTGKDDAVRYAEKLAEEGYKPSVMLYEKPT